jgi:hypothetical protein
MDIRKSVALATATAAVAGVVAVSGGGGGAAATENWSRTDLGAVLVGGNEVPGPGDADGWGLADVRVKRAEVCWRITVSGVEPIAAAHIHAGPAGVAGPVVVPLAPVTRGCTDVARRTARFIRTHPDQFYVNVHNAEFPDGALRGQLSD